MANITVPIQVNLPEDWIKQIIERLKNDPEAEWAQIIHCRDCKHHIDGFFCRVANHHTSEFDCCASVFGAERITDERSDR